MDVLFTNLLGILYYIKKKGPLSISYIWLIRNWTYDWNGCWNNICSGILFNYNWSFLLVNIYLLIRNYKASIKSIQEYF